MDIFLVWNKVGGKKVIYWVGVGRKFEKLRFLFNKWKRIVLEKLNDLFKVLD